MDSGTSLDSEPRQVPHQSQLHQRQQEQHQEQQQQQQSLYSPKISGLTLNGHDDANHEKSLPATLRFRQDGRRETDVTLCNDRQHDVEQAGSSSTSFVLPENYGLIDFEGPHDPGNPKNWPRTRRWCITVVGGAQTFATTFASSVFSAAINQVSEEFQVGTVVSILGVSLFLLGFVFGPILFGPASEAFGRRWPLLLGSAIFGIFQVPVAVATNIETIMITRFLGGFAASAPLAIVGGLLSDLWDPVDRAYGICIIASCAFAGPALAPVVGGFATQSHLGWRWTAWLTLILAAFVGIAGLVVIPETSAPKILQNRAKELRYKTKNWALHAKADEHRLDMHTILTVYLIRPFVMIVQEPILACVTAYMSFLYGILYLFFEAFPISFQEERGWSLSVGSLPFLSFTVGISAGAAAIAYSTKTNFKRSYQKYGRVIPEERLPPMIVGAIVLPVGLFWFAWTSSPHINWVPQVLSSALLGGSILMVFWQGINYIIDCYGFYSNSAIAVNTFIRSIAGAGFPLFAPAMYHKLGVAWATSLLGILCVLFAPVPILFYLYGAQIRARSKFTPTEG